MGTLKVWDSVASAWKVVSAPFLKVRDEANTQSEYPATELRFPDGTVFPQGGGVVSIRQLPTGVIGARAKSSGTQTITNNISTAVNLPTESWDTDGFHDTVTNNSRMTIPAHLTGTRKYLLVGNLRWSGTITGARYIAFYKNGSLLVGHMPHDYNGYTGYNVALTDIVEGAPGDYFTMVATQDSGGNRDTYNDSSLAIYLLGSGNVAGLDTARARRTSGSLTLNSTSWANVDTGIDLVVPAQAGDVLLVELAALIDAEAVYAFLDAATIVAGSPVNYISLTAGGASAQGVSAWTGITGRLDPVGGAVQYVVQSGDISAGNVTLRLRYRTNTATNKTLTATTNVPLQWSVVNLRGGAASRDIGYEFAYAEFTADVTVASTTEATPTNVVSAAAVVFDGNTRVCVELYSNELAGTVDGNILVMNLWDGSTDLGRIGHATVDRGTDWRVPFMARRYLTPSAGSHTFHWKAWKSGAGTVAVDAGAAGAGTRMPGYIRITKA